MVWLGCSLGLLTLSPYPSLCYTEMGNNLSYTGERNGEEGEWELSGTVPGHFLIEQEIYNSP